MEKFYSEKDIREDNRSLTKLLIQKNMTISTMESATAGQIVSLITDTEGASAIIKGAFVTYCNEAKIMQGVPSEVIDKYTVYSKETAIAMAEACSKAYKSDIGIGVTGTMGNVDPFNKEANIKKLEILSCKNWCTRSSVDKAEAALEDGDFYIYLVRN